MAVKLRLEQMLKKRKLSKHAFARLIKKQPSTVFRYFHENANPRLTTLEEWAQALKCRIRDLIED